MQQWVKVGKPMSPINVWSTPDGKRPKNLIFPTHVTFIGPSMMFSVGIGRGGLDAPPEAGVLAPV